MSIKTTDPNARPDTLPVLAENIPSELKQLPQWVCWRLEPGNPNKKTGVITLGKVPVNALTGRNASTDEPRTWSPFDKALARHKRDPDHLRGIGLCLAPGSGLAGLDLDDILNPLTGEIAKPEALEILERFKGTYAEISPSGKGLRLFCRGKPGHDGKIKGDYNWIETYCGATPRYLTVTGNRWPGNAAAVTDQQEALDWLHSRFMAPTGGEKAAVAAPAQVPAASAPLDDATLLKKARASKQGAAFDRLWSGDTSGHGDNDSSADMALSNMLAFWTRKDPDQMDRLFRQSGLMRDKWDERRGETTYGQRTIAKAIEGTHEVYSGRKPLDEDTRRARSAWLDGFVYMTGEDVYVDRITGHAYKPAVFRQLAERQFPGQWKGEHPCLTYAREGHKFVHCEGYYPGQGPIIVDRQSVAGAEIEMLNTYHAPQRPEPVYNPDHERLFLDHLDYLSGGDPQFSAQWLDWMATLIQHPGKRIHWMPVVISTETGTGKGIVAQILIELLGKNNVGRVDNATIGGQFQDGLAFKQLILVDELKMFDDQNARLNEFKTWITDDRVSVNRKGRPQVNVDNVANFLAFSNYPNALAIDRRERRYAVATCYDPPKPREYYQRLTRTLLPDYGGSVAGILHLLLNRDLSAFDPCAPAIETAAKVEMTALNRSATQQKLFEMLEDRAEPFNAELVTFEELREAIGRVEDFRPGVKPAGVANRTVGTVARAIGLIALGQKRLDASEKKVSLYAVRNAEVWQQATPAQIKAHLDSRPPPICSDSPPAARTLVAVK